MKTLYDMMSFSILYYYKVIASRFIAHGKHMGSSTANSAALPLGCTLYANNYLNIFWSRLLSLLSFVCEHLRNEMLCCWKKALSFEARALGMALSCVAKGFFFSLCNCFHIKGDKTVQALFPRSLVGQGGIELRTNMENKGGEDSFGCRAPNLFQDFQFRTHEYSLPGNITEDASRLGISRCMYTVSDVNVSACL